MNIIRKIIDDFSNPLVIELPEKFENRKLEIIVMLLEEIESKPKKYDFTDVYGQLEWKGDALVEQRKLRD